jgi:hypothetical protein
MPASPKKKKSPRKKPRRSLRNHSHQRSKERLAVTRLFKKRMAPFRGLDAFPQ